MKKFLVILLSLFIMGTVSAAAEPVVDFSHKFAKINMTMKLSKLKTYNWMMPSSLRKEIGGEYYPRIRKDLSTASSTRFKEGTASVEHLPDGTIRLKLDFPNFTMVIRNATWEEIDKVFNDYF